MTLLDVLAGPGHRRRPGRDRGAGPSRHGADPRRRCWSGPSSSARPPAGWSSPSPRRSWCVGTVVKYAVPGRRLKAAGVPDLDAAGRRPSLGVVGFFVIPSSGCPVGFVAGVYVAEHRRVGDDRRPGGPPAHALKAVGLSILIELGARDCSRRVTWAGRRRGHLSRPARPLAGRSSTASRTSSAAWSHAVRRPGRSRSSAALAGAVFVLLGGLVVDGDPTRPDLAWGVAGRRRQRARHRLPLPRPRRAAGWAWSPRSRRSAPPWSRSRPASSAASGRPAWSGSASLAALPGHLAGLAASPAPRTPRRRGGVARRRTRRASASACCSPPWARSPRPPGCCPLALNQLVAAVVIVALAVALRAPWVPRDRPAAVGMVCGALGAAATVAFLLATQPATSPSPRCWPRSTPRSRSCWPPRCSRSRSTGRRASAWSSAGSPSRWSPPADLGGRLVPGPGVEHRRRMR